jgi:hypothetical protein
MNLVHRPNADSLIQRINVLILEGDVEAAKQLTVSLLATPWRTAEVAELADKFGLDLPGQLSMQLPAEIVTNQQL